jgi:hypothetical protein
MMLPGRVGEGGHHCVALTSRVHAPLPPSPPPPSHGVPAGARSHHTQLTAWLCQHTARACERTFESRGACVRVVVGARTHVARTDSVSRGRCGPAAAPMHTPPHHTTPPPTPPVFTYLFSSASGLGLTPAEAANLTDNSVWALELAPHVKAEALAHLDTGWSPVRVGVEAARLLARRPATSRLTLSHRTHHNAHHTVPR